MSFADFARAFDGAPQLTHWVEQGVTNFDARLDKILALINHPDTSDHEREAGLRALRRIGLNEQGE